jgi:N6-L-threonylcarbamoyladenine synthase
MLSLLVSGGHTELVFVKDWQKYKKIGQTRDDAAGEAFDKVARMLELPYPGGPEISKLAGVERKYVVPGSPTQADGPSASKKPSKVLLCADGNNILSETPAIILPRPMIYTKDYDFSFSGLKTAVLYLIRDLKEKDSSILLNDKIKQMIAKEFEDAVIETLVHKTIKAIRQYKIKTLIVGGGVSANTYLQEVMIEEIKKQSKVLPCSVNFPSKSLTGDNALMIAIAGYFQYKKKKFTKNLNSIKAKGNLSL